MKKLVSLLLVALLGVVALALAAADSKNDNPAKPAPDAEWLAKARAAYPLTTCVVSGDKLGGDMGDAIDHVYKQEGKPDRLVRFCCKDCIADFKKDPAKYLAKIDEAAAKAKKN